MKSTKLLFLAMAMSLMSLMTFSTSAFAQRESASVTNYKQAVGKIVDTWVQQMNRFNPDLTKQGALLNDLNKLDPKSADYDKRKKAITDEIASIKASMDLATGNAEYELAMLKVEPSKEEMGDRIQDKILDFVQTVIKNKGIPLSNNLSFRPTGSWKFGGNSGSLGLKFNYSSKWF